jgi:hypothetical protein
MGCEPPFRRPRWAGKRQLRRGGGGVGLLLTQMTQTGGDLSSVRTESSVVGQVQRVGRYALTRIRAEDPAALLG